MRKLICAALAPLWLAGCVSAGDEIRWVKAGATPAMFDVDKAQCQYEATMGTPPSQMGRGLSGAIASGMADGMRKAELQTLCMKARGWQQTVVVAAAIEDNPNPIPGSGEVVGATYDQGRTY